MVAQLKKGYPAVKPSMQTHAEGTFEMNDRTGFQGQSKMQLNAIA